MAPPVLVSGIGPVDGRLPVGVGSETMEAARSMPVLADAMKLLAIGLGIAGMAVIIFGPQVWYWRQKRSR